MLMYNRFISLMAMSHTFKSAALLSGLWVSWGGESGGL